MPESRGRLWAAAVLALSLLPVAGVFTTRRIFFVRDLSFFFWSRHLWLRHTIFSGQWPWWDPFVAAGQSGIADALNELLMPIALAVRLLPSAVVSFNLWVMLPLPIAALGTFVFLRRLLGRDDAAALGACAFGLSGPIVTMLNLPNMAWSIAMIPWVFAEVERPGARRGARVAIAFALQALCGEPVTWAATGALVSAYVLTNPAFAARRKLTTLLGLAAGTLLAAAQLVPTLIAGVRAHRAAVATPDFWSLHPLSLWETVAPHLFGNYYDAFLADLPWMGALHFGRDPYFYSIYVGPLVLLVACAGLIARPRRGWFWALATVVFLLAACGGYTPFYPWLRRLVPALMYFRFPVKYLVFAVFAVAVLVAEGWTVIRPAAGEARNGDVPAWLPGWAAVLAALGLCAAAAGIADPTLAARAGRALAVATHLKDVGAGAVFFARVAPPLAGRAAALLLAGAILLLARARTRIAVPLLFAALCADLLITNAGLNLTTDVSSLAPPAWFTSAAGPARLYIGGRARGYMNGGDPDGVTTWQIPAEATAIEGRMELNALLPMAPSGWRVREALSYDLPRIWPAEYEATLRAFEEADQPSRDAFLRRSGVRWCVVPVSQTRPWRAIADVSNWNMRAYECHPDATRVFITTHYVVAADPSDLAWQRRALLDPSLPDDVLRLAERPQAVGRDGAPAPASARIVDDEGTHVAVAAALPAPGLLVLRDTYDASWSATVDGAPAPILRANGIYRAVALPAGAHVIRFSYRPKDFELGLILTVVTLLGFTGFAGFTRFRGSGSAVRVQRSTAEPLNRPPNLNPRTRALEPREPREPWNPQKGFTLLELMIVLAIIATLLAVSFAEYRGLQARGNEASAVSSMRAIAMAQAQFALTCGNMKYAATLPGLAQPVPSSGQPFLSPDLTGAESFEKSGYIIRMAAKPDFQAAPACNSAPVADGYAATADPTKPGVTGDNFYGVNADKVLYIDTTQTFTGNLEETGAPSHGAEVK
jgi:prepilin-type N-terminal cleavage/methylation domain-containing protein